MLEIYYGHNVSVYFFSSRGAPLPVTLRVQQLRSSNTNTAHTMAVKGRRKKKASYYIFRGRSFLNIRSR